ncbi:MAG: hypothetical protein ABUS57_01855 [Pseudomonadota bacterium]
MEISLDGPGAFAVRVVGVAQYQPVLARAAADEPDIEAALAPENDNPHDDQAVAVLIGGERAGYLSRDDARRYRAHLAAVGEPDLTVYCAARITGGFATRDGGQAHFGLRLDLPRFAEDPA